MEADLSPLKMFATTQPSYFEPTATISLAEASLVCPGPVSPPSSNAGSYDSSEQDGDQNDDDKKPAKKRKSWGQELPTPKTSLPPR